jgi:uncharacterized protein (TIGR02246 family)
MGDFADLEAGIRQLHARYADATWRKDYEAFADCFADDAEWRIAGMVLAGREAITSNIARMMASFERVLITFQTPNLQVGQGTASGRTYAVEHYAGPLYTGMSMGVYYEHFVRQSDGWRFAWRLFDLQYMGPADLSGSFFPGGDYGPPPGMPPRDAVPPNHSGMGA